MHCSQVEDRGAGKPAMESVPRLAALSAPQEVPIAEIREIAYGTIIRGKGESLLAKSRKSTRRVKSMNTLPALSVPF